MPTSLGGTFEGRVVLDGAALAELLRGPQGPVFRQVSRAGDIVKDGARARVGVWSPAPGEPQWSIDRRVRSRRPGTLRDSIVKRVVEDPGPNGFAVLVGSEDPIATYHHEGTQAHTIAASAKPLLVFWWGKQGRVVRAVTVQHPGTKPNRFLLDALNDLRGFI